MPIYEYECLAPEKACGRCRSRFEVLQNVRESPLTQCPDCGQRVRKIISWCRAAMVETSEDCVRTESAVGEYERQGMWSHAAELADKHSEKTGDQGMKVRALDNYKKAGYDFDLSK